MTQETALKVLQSGANVFLTGEPGSGKTHTINQFTKWLQNQGIPYAVTASTGIAATHINGVTIHSWSGIGIKETLSDSDIEKIVGNNYVNQKLNHTNVLIIDEISMLSGNTLNLVDDVLRVARNTYLSGEAFGGLQVVFVGDFFQLPPVSRNKAAEFAFESKAWKEAAPVICYLHEQHRQDDGEFLRILTAIRQGEVAKEHVDRLRACVHEGDIITQLFTHNTDVDRINELELRKIQGAEHEYVMLSTGNPYLIETLKKNCLSPEELILKTGALVMFTKNNFVDNEIEYVNGTLGIVDCFRDGMPVVRTHEGRTIAVERAEWSVDDSKGEKSATIRQLPLKLAWAVTVHKSQGMSLDAAHIDLSRSFEYGQGYVALPRVRSLSGINLRGINDMALKMHPKVIEQDLAFRAESDLTNEKYQ